MDALAAAFAVLILFLLLAALAAMIRFCVSDARRRGKSPLLVVLASVLFFPWGLIAWLIFRPDPRPGGGQPFRLEDHRMQ
jgi:hypothetical protein